ncbi:hypothetical protein CesoFtcFv8_004376 [Champsocephalus esox]|uniref:Uncharacterized protein n=1 Tax=Champsocephalus esox TaxID=159716 RepID=A0AAN8HCU1_9TELE|nr:hypothetical protein CesoFtcFv8_004376 [Champsocephalus esox]
MHRVRTGRPAAPHIDTPLVHPASEGAGSPDRTPRFKEKESTKRLQRSDAIRAIISHRRTFWDLPPPPLPPLPHYPIPDFLWWRSSESFSLNWESWDVSEPTEL